MLTKKNQAALIKLLDDTNPMVREALLKEFKKLGKEGVDLLKESISNKNPCIAEGARLFLQEIEGINFTQSFIDFIRSGDYQLETGILILSRTAYPDIDTGAFCMFIDSLGERCSQLITSNQSNIDRCIAINQVLFQEYHFQGDASNFFDPINSYPHLVIKRRQGLPISLSIIYMLVAQRCHLSLEAINLPTRFMLACFLNKENPLFIDPFQKGTIRTHDDIIAFLKNRNIVLKESHIRPISVGEILCRCCRNLVYQYSFINNIYMAELFTRFVNEFESVHWRKSFL